MSADVTLAYLHPEQVGHNFHRSLMDTLVWDVAHNQRLGSYLPMRCGTGGLVAGRNTAITNFLELPDTEWLWWVDTDMGWQADALDKLLDAADPVERPVVGGLCFAWKETALDGLNGYHCETRPTIMDWVDLEQGAGHRFTGRTEWQADTLTKCDATGSAMVLIHRSVFADIAEKLDAGGQWYDRIRTSDGTDMGEDVSFCARVGAAGHSVWVHTGVPTNHLKSVWVGPQLHPPVVGEIQQTA